MPPTDPTARLRATVARAVAPTATTRLVTLDAADLAATDSIAAHIALITRGQPAQTGTAQVDPLRLPLIEGIADIIVARDPLGADIKPRLREFWRVLAPAGIVVLVVEVPASAAPWSVLVRRRRQGNVTSLLAAAMFDLDTLTRVSGAIVVRAVKADGLAPQRRRTVEVSRPAPA